MRENSAGVKILQDNDSHHYLVPVGLEKEFERWCRYAEEGKWDGLKKMRDFGLDRIGKVSDITIFIWEDNN